MMDSWTNINDSQTDDDNCHSICSLKNFIYFFLPFDKQI